MLLLICRGLINLVKSYKEEAQPLLMDKRVLFDTHLNKRNIGLRDFLVSTITKYKDPSSSVVLEVGIGNGRFVVLLADKFKEYWGIDLDETYLDIARENASKLMNVHLQLGAAENIGIKKKFDVILFINSWHFTDNVKALKEVKGVIEKDGILLICEPTEKSTFAATTLQREHPDFDKNKFNLKLKKLKKAATFLEQQKEFKIIEDKIYSGTNNRCWVLRPGYSQVTSRKDI